MKQNHNLRFVDTNGDRVTTIVTSEYSTITQEQFENWLIAKARIKAAEVLPDSTYSFYVHNNGTSKVGVITYNVASNDELAVEMFRGVEGKIHFGLIPDKSYHYFYVQAVEIQSLKYDWYIKRKGIDAYEESVSKLADKEFATYIKKLDKKYYKIITGIFSEIFNVELWEIVTPEGANIKFTKDDAKFYQDDF